MTNKPKGRKRGTSLRGSSPKDEFPDGACSPWPKPIKTQHQLFVDAYLRHFIGRRAAIEAGYSTNSAHDTAWVLLNRPDIRVHIQIERIRRSERIGGISRERYLQEVERVALANMADFAPMFGDGDMADKLGALTRDQAAVIGSVTVEEFKDGRSDRREIRRTKFTLVPKAKGLEILGQANGWLVEKVDHKHQHEHQHLILGAMFKEIAAAEAGRPIVEVEAVALPGPIVEPEEAA